MIGYRSSNPAASMRGPSHVVKRGRTQVLAPEEARAMLNAIDVTTPVGLRDRALIDPTVYTNHHLSTFDS